MSYEIVIRFPDEMRQPLQVAAKGLDRSINSLVRVVVSDWLSSQPEPSPERERSASLAGDVLLSPMPSSRRECQAADAE
jgi:hypothetical protein